MIRHEHGPVQEASVDIFSTEFLNRFSGHETGSMEIYFNFFPFLNICVDDCYRLPLCWHWVEFVPILRNSALMWIRKRQLSLHQHCGKEEMAEISNLREQSLSTNKLD